MIATAPFKALYVSLVTFEKQRIDLILDYVYKKGLKRMYVNGRSQRRERIEEGLPGVDEEVSKLFVFQLSILRDFFFPRGEIM